MILGRKFLLALTGLFFVKNAAFQLSLALLILCIAYTLQVQNSPFMGAGDYGAALKRHEQAAAAGDKRQMVIRRHLKESKDHLKKKTKAVAWDDVHQGPTGVASVVFDYNSGALAARCRFWCLFLLVCVVDCVPIPLPLRLQSKPRCCRAPCSLPWRASCLRRGGSTKTRFTTRSATCWPSWCCSSSL